MANETKVISVVLSLNKAHILRATDHGLFKSTTFEFFHNFRLIRWIEQKIIYKKFGDMTKDWTQITYLAVRHFNHYTRMFSVLVWGCNWILFTHGWFCPIRLIHLIGWKSLHFEKKNRWTKFRRYQISTWIYTGGACSCLNRANIIWLRFKLFNHSWYVIILLSATETQCPTNISTCLRAWLELELDIPICPLVR